MGTRTVRYCRGRGRAFDEDFIIKDVDWSGQTFAGALSTHPDQPPIAFITFTSPVFSGGDTVFNGRISNTIMASSAIPQANMAGEDVTLFIDIYRTEGGVRHDFIHGEYIVEGRIN